MKPNKLSKSKKRLMLTVGIVLVVGVIGFIFYQQKLPTYTLTIDPTELSPFVSHEQARETICNQMDGPLFEEVCRQEFDKVGRNDAEKIGALFSLINNIENDSSISDYDRLLLAQVIFASLPTKDSPLALGSSFSDSLVRIKKLISENNVAHAQAPVEELAGNIEEFKKQMLADMSAVMDTNLPGQDNAWVINVSISKYAWVNGERQPLYSEAYGEKFDPYSDIITTTGEELENKSRYEKYSSTHVRSITGTYSTSDATYTGPLHEGSGEMIAYSFSLMSWQSKPYGADSVLVLAEAGPGENYNVSEYHFTEEGYNGDDIMLELFDTVSMPSREGRTMNLKEATEARRIVPPHGTPISKSEYADIIADQGCDPWIVEPETGVYCLTDEEMDAIVRVVGEGMDLSSMRNRPPTYPFYDGNQPWQSPSEYVPEEPYSEPSDDYTDQPVADTTTQPSYDDCQRAENGTCIPGSMWTESR